MLLPKTFLKPRVIVTWLAGALVAATAFYLGYESTLGPVIKGQRLSSLLQQEANRLSQPYQEGAQTRFVRREDLVAANPAAARFLAAELSKSYRPWARRLSRWLPDWVTKRMDPPEVTEKAAAYRVCVGYSLFEMGASAKPAIPALRVLLHDPEAQGGAAIHLHAIGPAAWPVIEEEFTEGDAAVRRWLIRQAAARFSPYSPRSNSAEIRAVIGWVLRACEDESIEVRRAAIDSFSVIRKELGDHAELKPAVAVVVRKIDDPDRQLRQMAVRTLFAFQAESQGDAVEALRRMAKSGDPECQKVAEDALQGKRPSLLLY